MFPADNAWNRDVSALPVAANSATLIASIGLDAIAAPGLQQPRWLRHPVQRRPHDPEEGPGDGFDYADESDRGPYPIPARPKIEGGSDRHILIIDRDTLPPLRAVRRAQGRGSAWTAGSGAIFNLSSNALRPIGWTSADAAGLPIFPGLARVQRGARRDASTTRCASPRRERGGPSSSRHATRPDRRTTRRCRRWACACGSRRRSSLAGFGPQSRIVLQALKRYGMILADNGSPWYITGAPSPAGTTTTCTPSDRITGSDFEVVQTG